MNICFELLRKNIFCSFDAIFKAVKMDFGSKFGALVSCSPENFKKICGGQL